MAKKGSGFYFLSQRNFLPQPSLFSHGNQQVPSSCHWNGSFPWMFSGPSVMFQDKAGPSSQKTPKTLRMQSHPFPLVSCLITK